MSAASAYIAAITTRRSIYALSKALPAGVTIDTVVESVKESVKQTPTSFNSQSGRAVVLSGKDHDDLWDLVIEALAKVTPTEAGRKSNEGKIASFRAGAGTVLFFEDQAVVKGMQDAYALYADYFPIWSTEASGILQGNVWTLLATQEVGASLQHYGALIESAVQAKWDLPTTWKLHSQMPFGGIAAPPAAKDFKPLEERVRVFNSSA